MQVGEAATCGVATIDFQSHMPPPTPICANTALSKHGDLSDCRFSDRSFRFALIFVTQ